MPGDENLGDRGEGEMIEERKIEKDPHTEQEEGQPRVSQELGVEDFKFPQE